MALEAFAVCQDGCELPAVAQGRVPAVPGRGFQAELACPRARGRTLPCSLAVPFSKTCLFESFKHNVESSVIS